MSVYVPATPPTALSKTEITLGRADGRTTSQLRPIYLATNLVSQATGSALFEQDGCKVLVSVYGPRPVPSPSLDTAQLTVDLRFSPWIKTPTGTPLDGRSFSNRGSRTDLETVLSAQLKSALAVALRLDLYPQSLISFNALILEGPVNSIGACIVAASLAAVSGGIEMYGLVGACSIAVIDSECLVDPTLSELNVADAVLTVGYLPALQQLTICDWTVNSRNVYDIDSIMELGLDTASRIVQLQLQVARELDRLD